jgi:hypothetical protein
MRKRWFGLLGLVLLAAAVTVLYRHYLPTGMTAENSADSLQNFVVQVKEPPSTCTGWL